MTRTPDARAGELFEDDGIILGTVATEPVQDGEIRRLLSQGIVVLEDGVVRALGEGRASTWQAAVDDRDVNTPPGGPTTGYRVIVGSSPTGAFVGHSGEIAQWNGSAWVFTAPKAGTVAHVKDEAIPYRQTALVAPWTWSAFSAGGLHASTHEPGGNDALAVDAVAGTGSLRTLGTGAQQACAGTDSRLSDARTPSAHAASHKHGGADEVATATAAANAIPKAGAGAKLDVGWVPTGSTGTTVCVGNDTRLSDARTPTAHKASHEPGGGDALTVDAVAGTGSLRTLGTSATSACAGNDSRLSDNRTDANAIHKAVSGEISAMTEKTSLVSADVFVIEDSAASFAKKKVQVTNLPGGVDTTAIHKATAGEIAAMTEKATPVAADLIVIEDSAAANAKKKVQIGNLPGGTGGGLKTKAGTVALSSFTGDPPSYAVTFAQAFVDADYAITFGSNRGTIFTWSSKTAAGFTIVRHSGPAGTSTTCDWVAVKYGES